MNLGKLAIGGAALALACNAVAQPRNPYGGGTRIPNPVDEATTDASLLETFRIIQKMGACVVRADPEASMALLMTAPGTPDGDAALVKVRPRLSSCLGQAAQGTDFYGEVKLKFSDTLLRGAAAEALYRLQFANAPLSGNQVKIPVAPILPSGTTGNDRDLEIPYAFAQCLTNAQPGTVRGIVLSKIGSDEEQAGFAGLEQAMAPCLTTGMTFKTTRETIRLMLAESLYRWAVTARQPAHQEAAH